MNEFDDDNDNLYSKQIYTSLQYYGIIIFKFILFINIIIYVFNFHVQLL